MTSFPPTPEQATILEAVTTTTSNLLIDAGAGAAKTSTLRLIAEALPNRQMLCLAFNKRIATEMNEALPSWCKAQTLNSLGLEVWKTTLMGRTKVDTKKMGRLYTALLTPLDKEAQNEGWAMMGQILKEARMAKSSGHVPSSCTTKHAGLMDDTELLASLDEELSALGETLLITLLEQSLTEGLAGRIDFDDMLLLPTVFQASFPRYPLVLVDEAQDLSPLNHAMLAKLAKGRLIAVGDQCQAIYAFRGASSNGMKELTDKFAMQVFPLSISFRCPPAIINEILWRAPHMTAWSGHPHEGRVVEHGTWSFSDLPDSAAIICRNNAPLLNIAVALLQHDRHPNLWGNDIAAGLLKLLQSMGNARTPQAAVFSAIDEWEKKKLKISRLPGPVRDRAECLRIFARKGSNLAEASTAARAIFDSAGPLQLMTGHKSKGHEFPDVFFLDEDLVGQKGQEANLRYVICTRSQRNLSYIRTLGCMEMQDESEGEAVA